MILVSTEAVLAAGVGSVLGATSSVSFLASRGDALPAPDTVASGVVFVVIVTLLGAVVPALVSAAVDPAKALRVP